MVSGNEWSLRKDKHHLINLHMQTCPFISVGVIQQSLNIGAIIWRTFKVMVIYWRTPRFEQFARRHSNSLKLEDRTPWPSFSRLRREKILFWTFGAPKPQLGPPLSLSLMRGPHRPSSSSSFSPLLFFYCMRLAARAACRPHAATSPHFTLHS